MNPLARRIDEALAGTPLSARLSPASASFAERRGSDDAARRAGPDVLLGIARMVATQPAMASFLSNRPAWLERAADLGPHTLAERGATLSDDGAALAGLDLEDALDLLRLRRREEMALAACADLAGLVPFEAVSEFLSRVAETTTRAALDLARRHLTGAGAGVDQAFAVIGMGKIAGREFTYHSDLDLIFLYRGGDAEIDRASRLGQRLIAYLTTMTGAGIAYEVDTRLRPSGQQGMLVASFEGYERYQTREAAPWEHLAMLRARPIAGALEEAALRLRDVRAAVIPSAKPPWPELADLRQRVIDERARGDDGVVAFKTGAGGLMDVDFLAGGGVLERGTARFPELPSVRALLSAAAPAGAGEALLSDYQLLRRVEACARWVAGRAVERLPKEQEGRLQSRPTRSEAKPSEGGPLHGQGGRLQSRPTRSEAKPSGAQRGEAERRSGGWASEGGPLHELAVVAELTLPGLAPEALRERVAGARRRIRAAYDRVIAHGGIAALAD